MKQADLMGASEGPPPKGPEPQFADNIPNITIPAGRDVTLPCVVDSLGDYKVRQTVLCFLCPKMNCASITRIFVLMQ
ncbi:hypothetical protein CDAR_48681 [Caerostris darwini]|uniref:Uncharacterized protein n=1 Tax=Caerostris darwini TaxID=1538125 RepID=A0AAV4NHI5_9ARAC|nr:hypothetical protein CDAR_48681 [Caerostris darwini]